MRILQPDLESLKSLSEIGSEDSRCILTLYFPGSDARASVPTTLKELPDDVLDVSDLSDDEQEHLERSLEVWHKAAESLNLPDAPGWLGVVSWMTDDVVFVPLPKPPKCRAYLDNSPYLYPAGRLLDDFAPYAVVYADHTRAVLYEATLGRLQEEDRVRGDIKNHVKKGGWSQQRYQRRRDNEIHDFCKAIAQQAKDLVEAEALERIVLAGDGQLLAELEKHFDAPLAEKIVARLSVDDADDAEGLFEASMEAAFAEEQREEKRLLKTIQSASAADGRAALGPKAVLEALRERRVSQLLIGPMSDTAFWRCHHCGAFGIGSPATCAECRGDDLFAQIACNEFTDLAFAGGCRVQFTKREIKEVGGVAALLRW